MTFAKSKGFISGYSDGSFHPNDPITRAEAVVMITQIAGIIDYDTASLSSFSDVTGTDWFAAAVALATEYEIVEGYGDGTFRPYSNISRGEAATVAVRVWYTLYVD